VVELLKEITTPFKPELIESLRCGEDLLISGFAFTMRDASLSRTSKLLSEGMPLPFDLDCSLIFYAGPTPPTRDKPFGAIGPTTSARLDGYLEMLFKLGVAATLGKGPRTAEAVLLHSEYMRVYFAAVGGLGALYARHVRSHEIVAFPELGCEAVSRVELDRFPALVAIDSEGRDFFQKEYRTWSGSFSD